jgi:ABC-2 type transport system permease protein
MLEGICANMSERGKRVECAPGSKLLNITAGVIAGVLIQLVSNLIVITYIQEILKINLGLPIPSAILICTIGSGLGMSTGTLIGSVIKNNKLLVAVPLFYSMTC